MENVFWFVTDLRKINVEMFDMLLNRLQETGTLILEP